MKVDNSKGSVPEKEPKGPKEPKVEDFTANAKKFKEKWDVLKKGDDLGRTAIPGTRRSIQLSNVEVSNNKISVWTSTDKSQAPDFVIVNPPTTVINESGVEIEDPLTAIAIAIDGASN